jgi:predicted RNA binding protein YcfA (HicA-like mRNA interferase family)
VDRRTFSGHEVVEVLVNAGGFEWRRTTGDHAQLYYEHPTNEDDERLVTVPLHDELQRGRSGASPSRRARTTSTRSASGSTGTPDDPSTPESRHPFDDPLRHVSALDCRVDAESPREPHPERRLDAVVVGRQQVVVGDDPATDAQFL